MPRPACAWAVFSAPLFLESVYEKKTDIPSEFQTVWICRARPGPALSADKNVIDDAPTHPLTKIAGNAHERHMRIKSEGPGPLTTAAFVFNDPLTDKVI